MASPFLLLVPLVHLAPPGVLVGDPAWLGREVAHEVLVGVRWLGIDRVATAAMVVVPVLMNATGTTGLVIDLDMALRTIRRIATGTVRIVPETVIGLVAGLGLVTREHSCLPYPRHPSLGFLRLTRVKPQIWLD